MEVLHYIADAHLRSVIRFQWHLLLLLYIAMCARSTTTRPQGANTGYDSTTTTTTGTTTSGTTTTVGTTTTAIATTMEPCVIITTAATATTMHPYGITAALVCQCNSTELYCANINPPLWEVPQVQNKNIRHLDLTGNAIEKIKKDSFLGLEFLETLCLGNNSIYFIHPQAFKNLYRLEMLNLEGNSLGNLDPSGRTFQHLSSLKFLYLQTSGIKKVNKYSFLAMAASSTHVTVNLGGNPIACDCDVWALKQWKQTSATGSRTMINLYCDGRPYMEVPDTNSTFESCNASTDAVFSDPIRCPICVNEITNNRCLMPGEGSCHVSITQAVCHKTVAWDSSSHTMQLSSRCDSYDSCMQEEANNKDTCGLDFQSNKSMACSFCCRGPTCDKHSIGGRTRDFTFYLDFIAMILDTEFLNVINSTISEQIVPAFSGIEGGIDENLYTYVDQGSPLYWIVLEVHLTTFNTMSEDEISRALENQSGNFIRALFPGDTTSTVSSVTVTTYFEGLECRKLHYPCPLNMICTDIGDGIPRCLCNNPSFYNSADKTCSPLTKLQVANIIVSSATTDKVCLTWTAHNYGHNVTYSARVTPDVGESLVSSITSTGASFSGLHAGTEYNFTITSTLNAHFYERLTETLLAGVYTKFGHGMTCDSTEMCDTDLSCRPSLDGRMRCLCNDTNFYLTSSRACLPMTALQVSNLRVASSTNTSIKFTWTANKYGINVTYTIQPSPYKGQVVASSLGVSGAEWTGLDPGSQYNFTVTAWLVTGYYTRYIITPIWGLWTQSVHGGSCDVNGTNGRVCMGAHINCTQKYDSQAFCMCSPGYFINGSNICEDVNELQVRNLTAVLITNDTVVLRWTADKHGRDDVKYRINAESMREQLQTLVDMHEGYMTGLNSKTQYNFSVISVLPADNFYSEMTVTSDIISIWTKGLRNVTINISYIKQEEFLPFMSNRSSPEYKEEEKRITTGVTAVLVKNVDIIYAQLLQFDFIQISSQQYKVDLVIQLTTYDAKTIGQVLSHVVQIDSQDINGIFYKENFTSLDMAVNDTEIIQSKCPFSVTSLNNGGIIWNESKVGTHYSLCPLRNPLDDFKPMAKRTCFVQNNGDTFPVWGEVNITQCLTKEQNKTPNIFEVFERNITTENAEIASDYLKRITNNSSNLTVEMINKSMAYLEMLTTERVLQLPNVATNVINCVNNLLNVNINILQQSEMDSNVSSRLLDVIDSVANKAPLDNGTFQISTENLAVHALTVNSTETRDITVTWQVSIDVLLGDNSQLSNTTSLMIPVKALVESLNDQQKQNLSRISFVVFHSDTLFSVIQKSGSRGKLHDDDDNDNHDNNNEVESRKNELYVTKINSRVISASVPGVPVNNLSRNITMNFEHRIINASKPRCVFWDKKLSHGRGDWSEAGCGVVDSDANSTTCGCNHLTNFALLMDMYDQGSKLSALDRKILSIISYVGCGISCFALLITLITYSAFKQVTNYSLSDHKQPKRNLRRDNPAKILINLCLALLCTNLVFLLGMQDYSFQNTASCKAVAVLLHYFLLASMSWMAVEAFYMYLALIVIFKTYYTNFILKCSIFGWGFPLLVIIITLAVNATDNYGFINSGLCWLKNPAFYAAFVGPVCFILLINCIAFILVVKQLVSMSGVRLHKTERNSTIQRLRGAVGVVILLGLTWMFAIFAIGQASIVFYYLFAIFNSLQGLFIFIFYCLLKSDAVLAMKRSLPCFEEYGESTKSYSNSKGETNTAAGHDLMERKTGSSNKNDHSMGTLSTTLDSRKNSCFSTLSGSNAIDDKDVDGLISNPSMTNHIKATSRLLQSSHDTLEVTSSTISVNSDKPIRYFSGIMVANPERGDITTANSPTDVQDTSFCQPPSEAGGGSVYNRVSASTHDPQPMGSPSRRSQTEFPENSSPILKHGGQTDEALHPSVRAEGEIDCSHLASVHHILHKFEHNILLTDIDNNVITAPEKPNQDYEDDTPSYTPTISDSPTRHLKDMTHFPDAKNMLPEAEIERQDSSFCEYIHL